MLSTTQINPVEIPTAAAAATTTTTTTSTTKLASIIVAARTVITDGRCAQNITKATSIQRITLKKKLDRVLLQGPKGGVLNREKFFPTRKQQLTWV